MVVMSWHIFFGLKTSPFSGTKYPKKQRGYAQKLQEIGKGGKGAWEVAGEYIRKNSDEDDAIYVWGWVPGIYVEAQRFSPTPKMAEGNMHTMSARSLSRVVKGILKAFEKKPPRYIVDSRKNHFPWDRLQLELWPIVNPKKGQFLSPDEKSIKLYDKWRSQLLHTNESFKDFGEEEWQRYEAMRPLREYVMKNYRIVKPVGGFWPQVVFERRGDADKADR